MGAQNLGKVAIGAAAFGAAAAAVTLVAATNGPSLEAKLGVLGVELSLSIGDAPSAGTPAYLEASMLHRSQDNKVSGLDLRVAKSGGLRAPGAAPADQSPLSRAAATMPQPAADQPCVEQPCDI
jgi:hypothetical protein